MVRGNAGPKHRSLAFLTFSNSLTTYTIVQTAFVSITAIPRRVTYRKLANYPPPAMSFGFSVGDFLAVLTLAKDLATALSETRGASIELRRLKTTLDSLQNAINNSVQTAKEWELAHPSPSNIAPFNALVEEHKICKTLLENFWKDSEKYTHSLLNGRGSKVKRGWAKIKWCMLRFDDAVVPERNLSMHVTAIDMYSCELRGAKRMPDRQKMVAN
jgi:hypothetical protein